MTIWDYIYNLKIRLGQFISLTFPNYISYIIGLKHINKYTSEKKSKKIFLTLVPNHKNLGDHAIAYATKKFIEENFKDYKLIEVCMNDIYSDTFAIKKSLNNDDIIMILGGGNMGDMYKQEEWIRRFVISHFQNNKIISLPQTIDFSNTINGQYELRISQKIYSKHKYLTIMARESKSYEIMKDKFKNNTIIKSPDMVLSLGSLKLKNNREGVLLCLRNDKESSIDNDKKNEFIKGLNENFSNVKAIDTVVDYMVSIDERENELNNIWNEISSSEVVITDRLHGMIFCAITETPCIVLKNSNHKIEQSYSDWLKDKDYIVLENNFEYEDIISDIGELIRHQIS